MATAPVDGEEDGGCGASVALLGLGATSASKLLNWLGTVRAVGVSSAADAMVKFLFVTY